MNDNRFTQCGFRFYSSQAHQDAHLEVNPRNVWRRFRKTITFAVVEHTQDSLRSRMHKERHAVASLGAVVGIDDTVGGCGDHTIRDTGEHVTRICHNFTRLGIDIEPSAFTGQQL